MIIVHLLAPARAGGLERVVQGLAIGQHARGHQVVVAAVALESLRGHPFVTPLERAGVTIREIGVSHRGYLKERAAVAALCAEIKPDVVHGHGYRTDVVDAGAIRNLGIATVATNHGATRGTLKNRALEWLHARVLRRFDAVIAVSRVISQRLVAAGVSPARIHVVPNAWSEIARPLSREHARARLGLSPDAPTVGWIGRMSREKGIDVFVDAMARVSDRQIQACAIGDGPERAREQSRAQQLLGERMVWPGMLPEAGTLCSAFDVFALSSRTEGIPITLFEAMAAGTPIVATKVGGVPDVLTEAEALLVAPEQPDALASAISLALSQSGMAADRARRARERLHSEFGSDRWLDRHEEIYAIAQRVRREAV